MRELFGVSYKPNRIYDHWNFLDVWLFVYGTLMDPEKAERIFRRLPKAKVAFLPGYEVVFNKEGLEKGNPNIKPGERGVWGVVYEVDENDLQKLDRISPKYERRLVRVMVNGNERDAWVYVAKPEFVNDRLKPDRSCIEKMVRGAKFHRLPEEYVKWLESLLRTQEP